MEKPQSGEPKNASWHNENRIYRTEEKEYTEHVRQILANLDSVIGLIQTQFYQPHQFHRDNKLNENIKQDLPPN
jgi:hypothetical protein